MRTFLLTAASAIVLAACGGEAVDVPDADAATPPPAAEIAAAPETMDVAAVLAADWRSEAEKARDSQRNPAETLAFFEVDGDETLVEIWPGGGWYTKIFAPLAKANGGTYIAAGFDPVGSEFRANAMARFNETYVSNPDVYGDIDVTVFSAESDGFAEPGTVDTVLTFRNVHNWMSGGYTDKFFTDAYAALKPGGILGVVEHRLPSTAEQDPQAASGYVHEDVVKAFAADAGFEFVEASEVNANPADTADHPFGVWTLPPVSRTEDRDGNTPDGFEAASYAAIGESDRMTLKFVKPAE
ncbi:MAG: hypothetical protein AAFQ21_02935 [Pseudomonadota bacterium]